MDIKQLVEISNYYGANLDFVLAGGGNTSMKDQDYLYVKGSGTTLATITAQGFVKMNRTKLSQMWEKTYSLDTDEREREVLTDLMNAREDDCGKRPSVETSLHDLFPQTFVIHTHPAIINGLTCGREGRNIARELFGEDVIFISSMMPGYMLAKKVRDELAAYKKKTGVDASFVILENHGIFVAADTVEEIKEIYDKVVATTSSRIQRHPDFSPIEIDKRRGSLLAPAVRMLLKDGDSSSVVVFRTNAELHDMLKDEESFKVIASGYTPDHVVYCKAEPVYIEQKVNIECQYEEMERKIKEYKEKWGFAPKVIAVQGLGIFAHGTSKKNADIVADVFLDGVKIAVYNQSFGGPQFLTDDMIDFITNWEAESYRAKVSLAREGKKRVSEKITIITGSAQGFGKGIADEMLSEGANIVFADLNYEGARENARKAVEEWGLGKAMAVQVDVSQESSVESMLIDVVLEYGGLDIFISNAGVLKAGSLEEMDLKSMEFVTKINYTAYFLCVKYASRYMKIQNRFDPNYTMDIIQINSKSGLTGSNKNFAYAGSKFGGIGLTQSFALELVPYQIKVNSICPGNLLDGPLWSDPVKGLFVQYLNAGKVPGAKTIEDVRRFYEAKVPMKRGCTIVDVVRAIYYCVEQDYETGQAIPVTGGQNMLN